MISLSSLIKHDYVQMGDSYALEVKPFFLQKAVKAAQAADAQEDNKTIDAQKILLDLENQVAEAEQKASAIVAAGEAKAQALQEAAAGEIEALRQQTYEEAYQQGVLQGYEDGYTKGYDTGYSEAYHENHEAAVQLQRALAEFEAKRQNLLNQLADEMKGMAFEIAGKVIAQEIKEDKSFYLRMINNMLDTFRNYQWVDIYVDNQPGLAVYLEENLAEEMEKTSKFMRIRSQGDVPLGHCMIETDAGVVDASVSTQMKQVADLLDISREAEG